MAKDKNIDKKRQKNMSVLQEELVQSPGRTAMRNFFARKLSVVGMVIFIFMFVSCFLLSALIPLDLNYTDSTRMNLPPSMNYLSVPKELATDAKAISLGSTFGAGIDNDGDVYMWGTLPNKKLNRIPQNMNRLRLISCGVDHIVAVSENNEIYAWGNDRLNITNIPEELQGLNIVDLQAGYQVTLVLDDEGTLHFWGNDSNYNVYMDGYEGRISDFAINVSTALAITKDKEVVCLSKADTQFKNIPEAVQGKAKAIASTDGVGAVVLDDGTVVTWGSQIAPAYIVPDEIQGRVVEISGGRAHFSAILDDGSLYSWGDNNFNQLKAPQKGEYEKVTAGYYQNAAINKDGDVKVWGQKGYIMGTDQWGRDMFVRLVHGGRVTLTVGFLSVIVTGIIGILVGGISGYFGGRVDMILMRFAEVVSSIPFIPLAIILSAVVAGKISETGRVIMIMLILGFINWPSLARLTRAQILSEKENEFVTAAKAMGIRERVIIFKHILPNVLAIVLVSLTLSMASCLLLESSLSFLGFGILEPNPTWGNMLNKCNDSVVIKDFWWRWVFPSIALGLSTISINIMGDGFRDAVDPKSGER